jgi:uncharacterized protein YqgC (DUF456 family)
MEGTLLGLAGWAAFGLGLLLGLLLIPLGLLGTWVILGVGVVLGVITGFERVELGALLALAVLAVVGEVVESLVGILAVRRYGASKWALLGTFLGGVAGGIAGTGVLPVVGSLAGAFAGSFVGAFAGELAYRRRAAESLRAGWGAFVGRVVAIAIKFEIGVAMVVILVWRVIRNG